MVRVQIGRYLVTHERNVFEPDVMVYYISTKSYDGFRRYIAACQTFKEAVARIRQFSMKAGAI